MRREAAQPAQPVRPEPVAQAVHHQRVKARVTRDRLPRSARGGIAVEDALDVGADVVEHGSAISLCAPVYRLTFAAACDMALATPRRMWISSGVGCARLNSWFNPGMTFFGAAGSR